MEATLTHEEACKLVEDAIERCGKTLAYIRLRLERMDPKKEVQLRLFEQSAIEDANILCNINWYGAYLKGARAMYCALYNNGYLDIPKPKDCASNAKDRIVNRAELQAYMSSARNMEWLLTGLPGEVRIRMELERNAKGKVVNATAKFVKKQIEYKEI